MLDFFGFLFVVSIGFLIYKSFSTKKKFKEQLVSQGFNCDKLYGNKGFIAFDIAAKKVAIGRNADTIKIIEFKDILKWDVTHFGQSWYDVVLTINDVREPMHKATMKKNAADECFATLTAAVNG